VSAHEEEPVSTILIGVDESAHSEDAVAFGRRLAGVTSGRIVLASAFPYNDFPSRAANLTYREALRDQAAKTVRRMVQRLDLPEERVERIVTADMSPARMLHDAAEQVEADLLVVGHTHHGHAARVVPGATAERLLHGAPCPVAVVPDGYRSHAGPGIGRIGVAYIDTPEARAALTAAIVLARALRARLEVITAVPYGPGHGVIGLAPDDLQAEVTDHAEAELEAVVKALRTEVWAEAVLLDGDPAEQLAAHSAKLDLMVMGSRGYGPLRAVLAGGVSGRVSREAHCPVIVVPRGVETPLGGLFAQPAATTA
jgi:nucleotide-binding universal stress UspA family protein